MGCSSRPTVPAKPSIVVISSPGLMSPIRTEQVLNALPLTWHVQAWHTPSPQPYLGPWTPSRSRRTQRTRTSSAHSTDTRLPLSLKLWVDMRVSSERPRQAVGGRGRDRRDSGQRLEAEAGSVVVDGELRGEASCRSGIGARHRRQRRGHGELARTSRYVGCGGKHHNLDVERHVPLARVERVVPAAFEEMPVVE